MAKSQQRRLEDLEKKKAAAKEAAITKAQAWAEYRHVYQTKWIRDQYNLDDPISEAEDEFFDLCKSGQYKMGDEAAFLQVLYAKIQREPDRFRRIYGDLFTPVEASSKT